MTSTRASSGKTLQRWDDVTVDVIVVLNDSVPVAEADDVADVVTLNVSVCD